MVGSDESSRTVRILCPHCAKEFPVSRDRIGEDVECPGCGKDFPAAETTAAAGGGEGGGPSKTEADGNARAEERRAAVTFTGSEGGYSFSLPTEGWTRFDRGDEKELGADIAVAHELIGIIKVMISPWELDFEDLYDGLEDVYESEVRDFRCLRKERTRVGGYRAGFIEYEGVEPESGEKLKCISHVFLKDKMVFQILGVANPAVFGRLRKEMRTVIDTFSLAADAPVAKPSFTATRIEGPEDHEVDAQMVLMTGLRWGAVAAAVALVLGIILTAKHPSGSGATIALVAVMPIGLGIITASYRWGAIAGMMGGGLHAIDKIATAIAEIYLFPLRIMSWIVGAAYGSALRSPEAARAIAGLMNRLFVLNVRLVLFLLGFCLCVLAGAPYAVYMIITKRTMVRAWGFVGLITVGLLFEIAGWSGFFALMEHGRGGEGPSGGSLTETTVPVRPDQQGVKGNTQREQPQGGGTVTPQPFPPQPSPDDDASYDFAEVLTYPSSRVEAQASSQLSDAATDRHGPEYYCAQNTLDGDPSTAWSEGADGCGIGQKLTYTFRDEIALNAITIVAGYAKSPSTFQDNHRLKRIRLTFDDGGSVELSPADTEKRQELVLGRVCKTKTVVMTVLDVYRGRRYDDLAFSEIAFRYHPDYLMPQTSIRRITDRDLADRAPREVRLIRNEIYARHKRPFSTDWIREYFESQPWYEADPQYSDSRLTPLEISNANLIKAYEQKRGWL